MIQWKNSNQVKINNINTSAIIEDTSLVLNYFADKYIITKYKINTGELVEYTGITYIIVSQIDRNYENRKEEQYNYRARIRQADFNIKVKIDDKLVEFPSIIEGQTFSVQQGQIITINDDKIIVIIKADDNSNKIKKQDTFLKLNQNWEVIGIDKTRKGLVYLFCESTLLEPNIPVDPEPTNPESSLIITGATRLTVWDDPEIYTVNTESTVKWTLISDVLKFSTEPSTENKCMIEPVSTSNIGDSTLKVELVSDSSQFAELKISLYYA